MQASKSCALWGCIEPWLPAGTALRGTRVTRREGMQGAGRLHGTEQQQDRSTKQGLEKQHLELARVMCKVV